MKEQFKIKSFVNKSGALSYRVYGMLRGKFLRENFKNQAEAITRQQNLVREQANMTPLPAITTRLTSDQCKEAEACFYRLENTAHTLTFAVDFMLRNYRPAVNKCMLFEAVKLFLAERTREQLRPDSIVNLTMRLNRFKKRVGDWPVSEVTEGQITEHLFPKDDTRTARSIINDRLVLANFFNWCVTKKYCAANPCASVKAPKVRGRKAPASLTLADSRKLMVAVRDYRDGQAVPYFVLGLFGGLRPTEITRLSWDDIDFARNRVDLKPEVAKTGEHRFVSLTPNMIAWLEPHRLKRTPFKLAETVFERVRNGITWPPDVMRHTAVSNYLVGHTDREATERHGHSMTVMLKHYRDRVSPEDAKAFWDITPDNIGADIVTLNTKAA